MVFRDCAVLCLPGKAFDTYGKAVTKSNGYTSELLADLLYFQWGSWGPLRMMGKLTYYFALLGV